MKKIDEKLTKQQITLLEKLFKLSPGMAKKVIVATNLEIIRLKLLEQEKNLVFEDHNFHINSDNWKEIKVENEKYLVNPEGDAWQIIGGEADGEQVFLWDAAIRETAKAGKRMPTDRRLTELLKTKSDMPNLVFAGYRNTNGLIYNQGKFAYFWSSTEDGTAAWNQILSSRDDLADRGAHGKEHGFSVRCLKKIKS